MVHRRAAENAEKKCFSLVPPEKGGTREKLHSHLGCWIASKF
jgi:hypothetical protein